MKERVYGEKVSIDTESTVSFYDQRAKTINNRKQEYTTVLLGDQDPDFSVQWDAYEKQLILPRLKLNQDKVILDIGCGMGRWAQAVADQCKEYYGVDFSSELIAVAKENIKNENCHFYAMSAVDAVSNPKITARKYDIVLDVGVSMYINEEELKECYRGLKQLADRDTLFYFEESVGKKERITLNHLWSDNLNAYYSAIYRTREEYKSIIEECMNGVEFIEEGYLNCLDKEEHAETSHWYALFRLKKDCDLG